MEIERFAEIVQDNVKKELGKEYQVTVHKINKNNGVVYTGLHVKKDGENAAPVIKLDDHFIRYKNGSITLQEIIDYVAGASSEKSFSVDSRRYFNYEDIRKNIVYRLINRESNKELLEDIPHIEFLDLAVIFRCLVLEDEYQSASILVHNVHMKLWDVTVGELFQDARENTQRLEEYEIKSMAEVMCEIMEQKDPDRFADSIPLYVLSNKKRVEGSACMLYPNLIRDFSDKLDSSLYIIPSSVHECLLLPTEQEDQSEGIKNMIKEINDTQVQPEERLSYSLYYYDKEECKIIKL